MLNSLLVALALAQPAPASPAPQPKPAEAPAAPTAPGPGSYFAEAEATALPGSYQFTEGPCWVPDATLPDRGYFVFCDVPADTVYRWSPSDKDKVTEFRKPSGRALGTAIDVAGHLYFAESAERQITRVTLKDGVPQAPEVLVSKYEGKRLNATNDLCVGADGSVYFTDPAFFTPKAALELDALAVYKRSPAGVVTRLTAELKAPNGIALGLDGRTLFINDYGANIVYSLDLTKPGARPDPWADLGALARSRGIKSPGSADGLRIDAQGRIITTGPGGLLVLSPAGKLEANLPVPRASNLAFGGPDMGTILVTAGSKVFTIHTKPAGAAPATPATKPAATPATKPTSGH